MSDNFVSDTRVQNEFCNTCRYCLHPHWHLVEIDYDSNLMWSIDANIARRSMNQDDARLWIEKLNYRAFNNWRLPSMDEFALISFEVGKRPKPFTESQYINVQEGPYWVSGDDPDDLTSWRKLVVKGNQGCFDLVEECNIWPIRTRQC